MKFSWIFLQSILIGIFQAVDTIYGPSASLARLGQFPYMVEIIVSHNNSETYCGGAIIDSTHILTAAHCVFHKLKEQVHIIAGAVNLSSINRIVHSGVAEIHVHKKYSFNETKCGRWAQFRKRLHDIWLNFLSQTRDCHPRHDIAVLTLTNALPFGDYIKPVNLPDVKFLPKCRIYDFAGWGCTQMNGSISHDLYSTQLTILRSRDCVELKARYDSSEFCAIDPFFETCGLLGDSGAPLVLDNVVYGLFVRGFEDPLLISVFTRVSAYLPFIQAALKK